MKRQQAEKIFKKMYEEGDEDVRESLFTDLLNNSSFENLAGLIKTYKSYGALNGGSK